MATANQVSQEILRGALEVGTGAPLTAAPIWFHFLAEVNVVLATVSLTLGIVLGLHGVYRIARSYWRRS